MNFLSPSWGDLRWSSWELLGGPEIIRTLPNGPGFYRVRPLGDESLAYVGQTGRTVRERIRELRQYRGREPGLMPFNDPHTAAASLWAWRDATGMEFACSGAEAPPEEGASKSWREGCEAFLLWLYRVEYGSSTLCNHGRFHPKYVKSSNKRAGRRGGRLPEGRENPAGGVSLPPLLDQGEWGAPDWMGLRWTEPIPIRPQPLRLPAVQAIYKVLDEVSGELAYIGESENLRRRFLTHKIRAVSERPLSLSFVELPSGTLPHQRHELENDCIGCYFSKRRIAPLYQFRVD